LNEAEHAVEELYFYRRYGEAVEFIRRILAGADEVGGLDDETLTLLREYERRCLERIKASG
jgi:hypothetical protein